MIGDALLPLQYEEIDTDNNGFVELDELIAANTRAQNQLPNHAIPEMNGIGTRNLRDDGAGPVRLHQRHGHQSRARMELLVPHYELRLSARIAAVHNVVPAVHSGTQLYSRGDHEVGTAPPVVTQIFLRTNASFWVWRDWATGSALSCWRQSIHPSSTIIVRVNLFILQRQHPSGQRARTTSRTSWVSSCRLLSFVCFSCRLFSCRLFFSRLVSCRHPCQLSYPSFFSRCFVAVLFVLVLLFLRLLEAKDVGRTESTPPWD